MVVLVVIVDEGWKEGRKEGIRGYDDGSSWGGMGLWDCLWGCGDVGMLGYWDVWGGGASGGEGGGILAYGW